MSRVPQSQAIAQEIAEFMRTGVGGEGGVTSTLVRLAAQRVVQELLEAEVEDYLGCGHYERLREGEEFRGYRNGYATRGVKTAEGEIPVYVPEVRDTEEPYRSRLMQRLRGNSKCWSGWSWRCTRGGRPPGTSRTRSRTRPANAWYQRVA